MAGRLAALREVFELKTSDMSWASSGAYFAYVKHPFEVKAQSRSPKDWRRITMYYVFPGRCLDPGKTPSCALPLPMWRKKKMALLAERLLESQR